MTISFSGYFEFSDPIFTKTLFSRLPLKKTLHWIIRVNEDPQHLKAVVADMAAAAAVEEAVEAMAVVVDLAAVKAVAVDLAAVAV